MSGRVSLLLDSKAIICATGAYERPVPVPGWTLPGVMTVGGSQVLIKSQRVYPGKRVLLTGTGPLQLVVANQMLDNGMDVVALTESAHPGFNRQSLIDLLHQPSLIKLGLQYLIRLKRAGVPLMRSYVLKSIEGNETVERATVAKIDAEGNLLPSPIKTVDVDTVCIGYGLIPATWLTRMLNCRHVYNPIQGAWVPSYDENMQTNLSGIFVAGDGAGAAGVLVAKFQGAIAGLYAAAHAGVISIRQAENKAQIYRKKLFSLYKFRRAMDRMYQVHLWLYANISDDTTLCRCEGVTAGEIRNAIRKGTANLNDIKRRTRMGMGYCQGTNCVPIVAAILTQEFGINAESILPITTRPPARPISMNLLMANEACQESVIGP